jgi:hypothetical protein
MITERLRASFTPGDYVLAETTMIAEGLRVA